MGLETKGFIVIIIFTQKEDKNKEMLVEERTATKDGVIVKRTTNPLHKLISKKLISIIFNSPSYVHPIDVGGGYATSTDSIAIEVINETGSKFIIREGSEKEYMKKEILEFVRFCGKKIVFPEGK